MSDTYSLAGSDPSSGYGVDVDENMAVMVSPGTWTCTCFVSLTVADAQPFPASSTVNFPLNFYVDQVFFDPDFAGPTNGTAPFIYDNWWNS